MSERLRITGHDGYVTVDVETETVSRQLPDWLDARAILKAAMAEYERQRSESVGPLPLPEHAEAWREYEGQDVMR